MSRVLALRLGPRMIWFIDAEISKKLYMGEESTFPHRTVIIADNYDQAVEKYQTYWDAKTEEYSVYYHVQDFTLTEAIN